ncbi:response regulator containing a CheY-like receiver domain and an HTH DNA-binding domain [Cyanobium sp. Copco_Reservoir_LC18]|uniref:response regulator transcription factor n=1 Tax=Cyanobium sp. Copco_Reservoir_LC18 TaxID=1328305 RepID=UPI001358D09B|nr:response regulator transcription factor [Cyanobium sp. Copco_Reservoir_LC18]KAF0653256.1 response regulator containing a CheY-like receiver domain and an HTH DNA-binding domain [Cyanobium sp. Copco_Reservoir_LC18]
MRVLLIEDDEAFRVGIEAFLLRLPAVTAVRSVSDGEQGLEALAAAPADVVVLDIGLPGLGGLETCRRISADHALPVLVLTSQDDGRWVQRLWDAGASGYLHKAEALGQLETALASVGQGASWWDRSATRALRGRDAPAGTDPPQGSLSLLTPRERQVLAAMAGGLTNRQIADRLGLGTGTVRVYLHTIFQKLQVSNRTQAVLKFLAAE